MKFKTKIAIINRIYELCKTSWFKKLFGKYINPDLMFDMFLDDNYPNIISKLQTYANKSIAISSTNGKKITTNIFLEILKAHKKSYVTNILSNEDETVKKPVYLSIIKDYLENFDIFKKEAIKDYFVFNFEEDELETYFNSMKFDCLLLNNLFIDQNDNLTLEDKRKRIKAALTLNSNIDLIINADEPYFYGIDDIEDDSLLNKKRNKFYFGFNHIEYPFREYSQKSDLKICPKCNCPLEYKERFYSHLGIYDCDCNFKRPKLDVSANAKIFKDYCFMEVFYRSERFVFKFPFGSLYNAYDALAAISLAFYLDMPRKTIATSFENYKGTNGVDIRLEKDKRTINIKTIKNPTSLTEGISFLHKNKTTKVIFVFDEENSSDTSWIWDSNFNCLRNFENKIYVAGKRFDDMALRLKYAFVNPCLIIMEQNIKTAIKCCFYDLKQQEDMLILSVPSKTKEIVDIIKKMTV